jgi:uncharacterized peroxidase-related enzyme
VRAHAQDLRQVTGDGTLAAAVARDWRSAEGLLLPRERPMLEFAEAMTRDPHALGRASADALRAAGFDDGEILEIAHVAGFFNSINRIVDALGIDPEP